MSQKITEKPSTGTASAFDKIVILQNGSVHLIRVDALTQSFAQQGSAMYWTDEETNTTYRLAMKGGKPSWEEITDTTSMMNGSLLRWVDEEDNNKVYKLTMKSGKPTWVPLS